MKIYGRRRREHGSDGFDVERRADDGDCICVWVCFVYEVRQ